MSLALKAVKYCSYPNEKEIKHPLKVFSNFKSGEAFSYTTYNLYIRRNYDIAKSNHMKK